MSEEFTGAELDTLVALVERGPLEDGDVPSKSGRDSLIERGLAVRIVGLDYWRVRATYEGAEAYKKYFGTTLGTEFVTIYEARASRIAQRTLQNL